MTILYGQSVRATEFDGSVSTFEIDKAQTMNDAKREVLWLAVGAGWSPPQWWQWWRRNDTTLDNLRPIE